MQPLYSCHIHSNPLQSTLGLCHSPIQSLCHSGTRDLRSEHECCQGRHQPDLESSRRARSRGTRRTGNVDAARAPPEMLCFSPERRDHPGPHAGRASSGESDSSSPTSRIHSGRLANIVQVSDGLAQQSQQTSNSIADSSRLLTMKSLHDSYVVKIVTVITVIYLPIQGVAVSLSPSPRVSPSD